MYVTFMLTKAYLSSLKDCEIIKIHLKKDLAV